jgi:hypothetical protein
MAVTPLKVTGETSVKDLQSFAAQVGKDATIHGKAHKDGSVTLYVSKEGKGTGLKDYLFGTTATRRTAANGAITQILFANTAKTDAGKHLNGYMGQDFTGLLGDLPKDGAGLTGAKLQQIAAIAKDSYDAATFPDRLPTGVTVDDRGNLAGGQTLTHVPVDSTGHMAHYAGRSIEDAFNEEKGASVRNTANHKLVGGQKIVNQATRDLWRLDYTIPQNAGGPFRSSNIASKDPDTRSATVAQALRQFAGSDAATTVLSEMLTQSTLIGLPQCFTKAGDKEVRYDFLSTQNTTGRTPTIRGADNSLTAVDASSMGGAKFVLSRQGNDFKVSVQWEIYAEPKYGQHETLPVHKDGCVRIDCNVDYIINGASAQNGQLQVSIPNGVQTQFSGRLTA